MEQNLISVIVPVYKVEKYLERCIRSIQNQSYSNLEIILVDDGSPDNCPAMCDRFAAEDSRIKVIHKENGGVSSARNVGLDICGGEYICFVDSDDYLAPDILEKLYGKATSAKASVVGCGFSLVDEVERPIKNIVPDREIALTGVEALHLHYKQQTFRMNFVCVWGKLFEASIFKTLRFQLGMMFEDIQLMPYILLSCDKFVYLSDIGYYYRQQRESIMHRVDPAHTKKLYMDSFAIYHDHLALYESRELKELHTIVECQLTDKILSHSAHSSIPEDLRDWSWEEFCNHYPQLLKADISIKKKIRYFLFRVLKIDGYRMLCSFIKR